MKAQRGSTDCRRRTWSFGGFLSLAIALSVGASVLAADVPGRPARLQPELLKALRGRNVGTERFEVGSPGGERVSAERVPAEVRQKAYGWISRVVASQWLPERGADLLVGETRIVQAIPPSPTDFLWMEYSVAGSDFLFTEKPGTVSILWRNPNIALGSADRDKTVMLLAQALLRVPDAEARKMQADLIELPLDVGGPLLWGHIAIPLEPKDHADSAEAPTDQLSLERQILTGSVDGPIRQWYSEMQVWAAPGMFCVLVRERTGQPSDAMRRQPQPGSPRRFLPAEASVQEATP